MRSVVHHSLLVAAMVAYAAIIPAADADRGFAVAALVFVAGGLVIVWGGLFEDRS